MRDCTTQRGLVDVDRGDEVGLSMAPSTCTRRSLVGLAGPHDPGCFAAGVTFLGDRKQPAAMISMAAKQWRFQGRRVGRFEVGRQAMLATVHGG